MNRLSIALTAAVIALMPVSAQAIDRLEGTVWKVDTSAFGFTIRVNRDAKKEMSFKTTADKLDEFEIDVNDRVVVECDKSECGGATDCIPTAMQVERKI